MIDNIQNNWSLFRFIRLAIGLYLLIDGVRTEMWILIAIGIAFTAMPLLNIGCCARGNCAVSPTNENSSYAEEGTYEEVNSK
ncbi:hypothetical protein [Arenibacter certesii]|uniref:DUF2892 domain-containing protein n=1 Tax=Arenibacter certesii TaxID=228955 RepID=A0A918IW13_9FLAO|nr:hypothetical protein [Arenibacter certesii]GGW34705.1 hypothetical protein GCM10007383_19710 [Arenibacter certesii]